MNHTGLQAGVCVVDITPLLEVGLLTSSVKGTYAAFRSVRTLLKARVLVLQSGNETAAIVTLDLLSLTDTSVNGWQQFKEGMAGAVPAEKIILCYTHTHSAPESGAITGLYKTPAFRSWLREVQLKIKNAIATALKQLSHCRLSVAVSALEGYSLQRRVKTASGITMSDALQPVTEAMMNAAPVDRRVKSMRFTDAGQQCIATWVQAVCHPVHEMCMPQVSAEFPGEFCDALEASGKNGTALFCNGAAGDTNPPTVSMGPAYAAAHGRAMATLVEHAKQTPVPVTDLVLKRTELSLGIREGAGISNAADAIARISLLHTGTWAVLFLPGEIFIETALEIERQSPFEHTVIAGFSENNIGYVPTAKAFAEGGYETGPGKWSFLEEDAALHIQRAAIALLHSSFAK